jgi:hypothetical protein
MHAAFTASDEYSMQPTACYVGASASLNVRYSCTLYAALHCTALYVQHTLKAGIQSSNVANYAHLHTVDLMHHAH